jgi:hypothetical protein
VGEWGRPVGQRMDCARLTYLSLGRVWQK